jgi:hypothetical protein
MHENFIYYANEMSSRDDVRDEIFSSCDEMFFRIVHTLSNDETRAIAHDIHDAYYETFDVDSFIERNNNARNNATYEFIYSRMHAQSFVIMNLFDVMNTHTRDNATHE